MQIAREQATHFHIENAQGFTGTGIPGGLRFRL